MVVVKAAGNCGMEFYGFHSWSPSFSIRDIAAKVKSYNGLASIVVFSGNQNQENGNKQKGNSPGSFAKWLEEQGEKVHKGFYTTNKKPGHRVTNKIRAYIWNPSDSFRAKVKAECRKQGKVNTW